MTFHDGMFFSAKDADNDNHATAHCARDSAKGGWWYDTNKIQGCHFVLTKCIRYGDCYQVNLNGHNYNTANAADLAGIVYHPWRALKHSLKTALIAIKPA